MRKYLLNVHDRFRGFKNGITLNAADWATQPDTPATMQTEMDTLAQMDQAIGQIEDALAQKVAEARALAKSQNEKADIIEKRAIGIHAATPGKLNEYNIKVPAGGPGAPRPIPGKAIIGSIANDDDGIGFKIKIQPLPNVDHFEVERAVQPATANTVLQPPYPFLRTTKKLVLVDDDVNPGSRHFYRVRGVNASGPGEWSEPVNGVQ
jgi:hypothetical protein